MISKMSRLIVPILIVMAVVLAACSTSGSDDEASFAFAEDTAASSGTFVTTPVESEMAAADAGENLARRHRHARPGGSRGRALGVGDAHQHDRLTRRDQRLEGFAERCCHGLAALSRSMAMRMRSGVAGVSRRGQILWPATLATASDRAWSTDMASIRGGSPTALEP